MVWYWDWTWILLIPALIVTIVAQARVSSAYGKYSKIPNSKGISGADYAGGMLRRNNVPSVHIASVGGQLSDNFDPRTRTVNLSEGVYSGRSIASVAVAAHECGHVLQKEANYAPMAFRSAIVPVTNICSRLAFPLVFIGLIFSTMSILAYIGAWIYFAVVIFQLVTLPVEFNASRRALADIEGSGMFNATEQEGMKKMLSAAAMTYVAALLAGFLSFLRLLLIARRRN